ncbi:bifunctional phosphopantothenoylcysteine decarboxylase/phosphopantothenate--cysteine ligase CoaBC [bacterium]|nr:bifunctional phosphopantothenoylcysteine decarboxylase/phosphopantothenate--cysteine ligase CoaBC [bacterium]
MRRGTREKHPAHPVIDPRGSLAVHRGSRILLGVCGGIAAYKACELARMLMRKGMRVQVVLTPHAAQFVTPLTFAALTGEDALIDEFSPPKEAGSVGEAKAAGAAGSDVYAHLNASREINCFVIAPVSASTLAKLASGLADNLLTAAYLSNVAPVVIAPAMNTRMWEHPAVQANVATLKKRGDIVVDPGEGELACGDEGGGRLAELDVITAAVADGVGERAGATGVHTSPDADPGAAANGLAGKRIVVTAGGTREYLDPVRFITNASSGRLGFLVAEELLGRGAEVDLVEAGVLAPGHVAARLARRASVQTSFDLEQAMSDSMEGADALVMLAAVTDYGPANYLTHKRKKDGSPWALELVETQDVLSAAARARKPGQVLIGVSLEDADWLERAVKKTAAKGVDMMLAVELGADLPFAEAKLNCALVDAKHVLLAPAYREKEEVAGCIADWLAEWFSGNH